MRIQTMASLAQTVDQETGEQKINIAIPPFKIAADVRLLNIHYVTQDEVMRPDLISVMYYGTHEYMDIILKANSISNPFCIKEGMFLIIPEQTSAMSQYKPIRKSIKPRTQFQDKKRITPTDKKRLEFLAAKSSTKKNGSSENLPPNMLKSDQKSKIVQGNDTILLGANLGIQKEQNSRI